MMPLGRWLLIAIMALTPWQLYVVGTGFGTASLVQLSLALLIALWLSRELLRPGDQLIPINLPFVLLACFCGLVTLSIAWSPDRVGAAKTVVKISGILIVAIVVSASRLATRRKVVAVLGVSSAVLALAVVAFRIVPAAEAGFLLSPVARFVVDPDMLTGLAAGTERANVLAEGKAGGVFTNANVASLFFGMVVFLAAAVRLRGAVLAIVVTANLAAVLATGSKAGLAALAVTGSVWCVWWARERRTFERVVLVAGGALVAAIGLLLFVVATELWTTAESAAITRWEIWRVAFGRLAVSPITGLGFGGWERWIWSARPFEGVFIPYPIQNLFLIAWSWAGLGAMLVVVAFTLAAIVAPWRVGRSHPMLAEMMPRISLSLAFVWFSMQSMFTNAAVTDIRIGIPLGIALGLLAAVPNKTAMIAR